MAQQEREGKMTEFVLRSIVIGVGATAVYDLWGRLLVGLFGLPGSNWAMAGRWFSHMTRGQFTHANITAAQTDLTAALSTLRTNAASLGNNNTIVQTRSDYTDSLISTLQTASDNLILADTNEEGANLQALQAQSQLGVVALGISGQQAQSILRLF